jgi:hypothetical protein
VTYISRTWCRSFAFAVGCGGVMGFLGCGTSGSSSTSDAGVDSDAGSADAAVTLPADLEVCGATAPADDAPAFNGGFQVTVPSIHLGDGVRNGALVGTPTSPTAFEKAASATGQASVSAVFFDDAQPLRAYTGDPKNYDYGAHVDTITDPLTLNVFEAYGSVTGAHAFTTKDFERWVRADQTLDIVRRGVYQTYGADALGSGFTPTGEPTMMGDEYVFDLSSALLLDVDIRIRPHGDAACHIRNMKRLLNPGHVAQPTDANGQLTLEDLSSPIIAAYVAQHGVTGTTHALALGTMPGDPFAGTTPCDLAKPAACGPWATAVIANAHALLAKQPQGPAPDAIFKGTLPSGWIILGGTTTTVP